MPHKTSPRQKKSFGTRFASIGLLAGAVLLASAWVFSADRVPRRRSAVTAQEHFDGRRAYESLKQLCAIGPRPSGSPGMALQQKILAEHYQSLGGKVEFQRFDAVHPQDGSPVPMANIIVRWHPESTERVLLCAHYDTLPFPLLDRRNPRGTFVGANDNASGVALLMELARHIPKLKSRYGVDFALFDGEEYIFDRNDPFFIGSEHFARDYAKNKPPYHYRWGVLLDMIGDADLRICPPRNCMEWPDTRPLVQEIWAVATRLGVREFDFHEQIDVRDDHVMLHDVGGIACIDVIDFDYPPWHTEGDTPDKCSPDSLAKVGWVILEWLQTAR